MIQTERTDVVRLLVAQLAPLEALKVRLGGAQAVKGLQDAICDAALGMGYDPDILMQIVAHRALAAAAVTS